MSNAEWGLAALEPATTKGGRDGEKRETNIAPAGAPQTGAALPAGETNVGAMGERAWQTSEHTTQT